MQKPFVALFAVSSLLCFASPASAVGVKTLSVSPEGDAPYAVATNDLGVAIQGWQSALFGEEGTEVSFLVELDAPAERLTLVAYRGGALSARLADGTWIDAPPASASLQVWSPRAVVDAVRLRKPGTLDFTAQRKRGAEAGVYSASVDFLMLLDAAAENLAPSAGVLVSSAGEPSSGFQPRPWVNQVATLTSGEIHPDVNFSTAAREDETSPDRPEWILLRWDAPQAIHGVGLMRGRRETGLGDSVVEVYTGEGDPRFAAASDDGWRAMEGEWLAAAGFRHFDLFPFPETVATRGVRLRSIGGTKAISAGEVMVLGDARDGAAEAADADALSATSAARRDGVPISFAIPADGKVTLQIRDAEGAVVANPVAGVDFPAGTHTVSWNLDDIDGNPVLRTGEYSWRGLFTPPLSVEFRHTYHPWPLAGVAWQTPDRTGGWLADHEPPRTVCRGMDGTMWIGAFAEAGDSIVHVRDDATKIWGIDRCWVAIPSEICCDGDFYYGLCEGGWIGDNQVILQINQRTHADRKIFQRPIPKAGEGAPEDDPTLHRGITGFQVVGNIAYLAFGADNLVQAFDLTRGLEAGFRGFGWDIAYKQFDDQKPVLVREIPLPSPGRLRPYGEGRLVATSGKDVVTIDLATGEVSPLFQGKLRNPLGLGTDAAGNVYVGEGAPLHQVFGYAPDGTRIATLGKPGRREVGPFDPDDLEEPYGVEVASDGRVWVMEHVDCVRRVSLWDAESGRCVKAVYGPTRYGGGGCIDPDDDRRLFYKGLEFRRDAPDAPVELVNILYRVDSGQCARFNDADYPGYCFRTKKGWFSRSRLWFTSYMAPHGHPSIVLWLYKGDRVQPVAAIGSAIALRETFGCPAGRKGDWQDWRDTGFLTNVVSTYDPDQKFFTWTDLDDDGFVQPEELRFGEIRSPDDGALLTHASAGWNWRMNHSFEAAAGAGGNLLVFFRPKGFSKHGYPLYDVPSETVRGPRDGQGFMTDSAGNAIVLGSPLASVAPDGTMRWRYLNQWPGLHAGHHTTAYGNEPGVLIAPTRVWGIEKAGDELGEVVAFNSNLGCTYLMTAEDGLFIDRVFRDQRVGLLWNFNQPPAPEVLRETSLYDEHFGGIFQTARGRDGKAHFYYVVGKNHCTVVELCGLENVKRLPGGTVEVLPEDVELARSRRLAAASRKAGAKVYDVPRVADGSITVDASPAEWAEERIDGFALAFDSKALYVLFQGRDDRAPFENKGVNPLELFKSGDVLDVMLQTKPGLPANRREAGEGDLRISLSMFEGEPVCVVYDFVNPQVDRAARIPFSSPWRTVWCDRAGVLESATIAVDRHGGDIVVEAAIPLSDIHFDPSEAGEVAGDVGRVLGDATATRATRRDYWSNKNTQILSDLPSEAGVEPCLWGLFRFAE
jgi:hypothetical protein